MGYALVQNPAAASGSGASISKAFGSNIGADNTLVAFATCDPNTTHTYSSPGDTWTTIGPFFDAAAGQSISIGVCFGATAGAKTVTCTFGATGTFDGLIISSFSGGPTTMSIDKQTSGQNNGSSSTPTDASMTTTAAGDLVIGCLILNSLGATISAGSGFTLINTDAASSLSGEYQVQSAAGAIATSWSLSAGTTSATISVALLVGGGLVVACQSTNRHPGAGPGTARFYLTPAATDQLAAGTTWDPGTQTDSVGLTDSVVFEQDKVLTDSAGLTDTVAIEQDKVITDSAGLTDTFALTQSKVITDSAGLTDTTATEQDKVVTDSAGLTDAPALEQDKVVTDSAGLTDTTALVLAKVVNADDPVGLTDTTVLDRVAVFSDDTGLSDPVVVAGGAQTVRGDATAGDRPAGAAFVRDQSGGTADMLPADRAPGLTTSADATGGTATAGDRPAARLTSGG